MKKKVKIVSYTNVLCIWGLNKEYIGGVFHTDIDWFFSGKQKKRFLQGKSFFFIDVENRHIIKPKII